MLLFGMTEIEKVISAIKLTTKFHINVVTNPLFVFSVLLKPILRTKSPNSIKYLQNMNYSIIFVILSCIFGLSQVYHINIAFKFELFTEKFHFAV